MKRLSLVLALVIASLATLVAQRTVTGTVVDDAGEPLIGATVLVAGTSTGTITDIDGNFSLQLPENAENLQISYTGYSTQVLPVGTTSTFAITLDSDVIGLEDVIVVGYAPTRRKDITGAVSSVNGSEIQDVPTIGVQNALQGRTAGVTVVQNSGTPGGGIDVRVRGSTSINASNQPLYVVDGVIVRTGNLSQIGVGNGQLNALSDLNPNDIESIEVLKDAATAAIYGARAANGVVLITTKSGKAGRTKVGFNASYGFQDPWNTVDMLNSQQYKESLDAAFMNRFGITAAQAGIPVDTTVSTNWQDEIFQTGGIQDYNLVVEGGDLKTKFYTSLTYFDTEGIVAGSGQNRYNARLNLDHSVSDKFVIGSNMSFTTNIIDRIQNDNNIYGAVSSAVLLPPDIPIFNEDGSYGTRYGLESPVAATREYQNNVQSNRFIGNIFGRYEIVDGLSFKASLGTDILSFQEDEYIPVTLVQGLGSSGQATSSGRIIKNWITEYTLTYQKTVGRGFFTAVVGHSQQEERDEFEQLVASGFPTPSISTLNGGAVKINATSDFGVFGIQSYFGTVNYSFDDRYIISAVFRADASSRFTDDEKFAYFPGVSAAWRLSSEPFLADSGIDDLKLRASYGVTGNQEIGNFSWQPLFLTAHYAENPGYVYQQLGNPNLRWETTSQLNFGLDFAFVNGRIGGSIDYYIKETDDLLFNRPLPTTSGYTSRLENIGSIENRGIELNLRTLNVNSENFTWSTAIQLSRNDNEVTALYENQPLDQGFGTRIAVGEPVGSFFGYVTDGIFQNEAEVEAHATQTGGTAPGDIRFVDLNNDGVINDEDREFIGNPNPDLFGGITNTFTFGGLELSAFFQFSLGNEILNNNTVFAEGMNSVFNQSARTLDRWTQEGDQTDIPRAVWGDPNNNRRDSDRFVENGSYLRLKTATVAYRFPTDMFQGVGLSGLRVYVAGQNLLTWTDYSWFDPEVNTFDGSNAVLGTDFLTYPQSRSVVFGLNATF